MSRRVMLTLQPREQRHRGWVGKGARTPLVSEIQKILRHFKTLFELRMCVMTSCDLNVSIRRKNIKLCLPLPTESLPTMPL